MVFHRRFAPIPANDQAFSRYSRISKTKFRPHDYSIWTQHQGEAIFGFNSHMTTEEFHKRVHKVHIEHLNMIPKHLQTEFCNSKDSPRKLGKPPFQDITTKPSIAMVHDFIHFVFQSL